MGIILAYDVTDDNSFNNIRNWMRQIETHASENVAKILIGNKCDRADRKIPTEQGQGLASEFGIKFMETSAKNNININEAFYYLAKDIKDKRMTDVNPTDSVNLNKAPPAAQNKKKGGGCCK